MPCTGLRPWHLALTCQLLSQHVELIGVQATPHVRGELPAYHLQELAQSGWWRVVKENQVLKQSWNGGYMSHRAPCDPEVSSLGQPEEAVQSAEAL